VPQTKVEQKKEEDDAEITESSQISSGLVDGTFGLGNTAYEMLARMSRNLSPLRHYFDSDGEEGTRTRLGDGPATESELEELGFWSDEDGDEDDDDEEDEEGFEEDDEEEDGEDYEDSDSDDGELDLRLIGHR